MRSRMIIMVALLAVAGVMAAMAYSTASVKNDVYGTIVGTDSALLALSCNPGVGNKDAACDIEGGRLNLDFSKGRIANTGFQPGSTYAFTGLIIVTNNSNDTISVSASGSEVLPITHSLMAGPINVLTDSFDLAPGISQSLDVSFTVPDDHPPTGWGQGVLTITGTAK